MPVAEPARPPRWSTSIPAATHRIDGWAPPTAYRRLLWRPRWAIASMPSIAC